MELITNIEKLTFRTGDNEKMHFLKQELLAQITSLDISISGNGFFIIDRQFFTGVRECISDKRDQRIILQLFDFV